jgi:hypothetical protein
MVARGKEMKYNEWYYEAIWNLDRRDYKKWINGALFPRVCEWEKLCQVVLMCDYNEIM